MIITGLAAIILNVPFIRTVLLLASAGYLGYVAFRIALAGSKIRFIQINAPGFVTGMGLQFINPKVYAVNTTFFTGFAFYPDSFVVETGVKLIIMNAIWIPVHMCWLYAGCKLNELNLPDRTQKLINISMATCLVVVVGMSVWSVLAI